MLNTNAEQQDEAAIVEGWARLAAEYEPRGLNGEELAQVERASLSESQAEKTPFTLGCPIKFGF